MDIAQMMLRYRAKHNISQREFAQRAGLALQTVNSIENRLQRPTPLTVEKIKIVIEEENENDTIRDQRAD